MSFTTHLLSVSQKKNVKILAAMIAVFCLMSSCKDDIDLRAPYNDIPVVFGLLDKNKAINYIRIQKTFLASANAADAASVFDSIYYRDSLRVEIRSIPNGSPILLTYLNGNENGIVKAPGLFADSPHVVYKLSAPVNENNRYRLEVTNLNSGKVITSETAIVGDIRPVFPLRGFPITKLGDTLPRKVIWQTAKNAAVYELKLQFHYLDVNEADPNISVPHLFEYSLFREYTTNTTEQGIQQSVEFDTRAFLRVLANNLSAPPAGFYREIDKPKYFRLIFTYAGDEYAKYLNARRAQSGITQFEALPPYTNVKGGIGILSSSGTFAIDSVVLDPESIDSLGCSSLTRNLGFRNRNGIKCQ